MSGREMAMGGARLWGPAILTYFTFQALLFVPQTYYLNAAVNPTFTLGRAVVSTLIPFYLLALLTPPVLWLGARFPFGRVGWPKALALHFVFSVAFSLLHLLLLPLVTGLILGGQQWVESYRRPLALSSMLLAWGAGNIFQYWSIISAGHAFNYFRKYREREHSLTQAQLAALRSQLHPHFLFNTLNAIAELIHRDPHAADRSILRLGEMLRISLESSKAQEAALSDEVGFLEKYVEIQRMLMGERLRVHVEVEPEALGASVPSMLLQPLVENAIKHGIAPRREGGVVVVRARRAGGELCVEVRDDGLGMPLRAAGARGGVGLLNTRERLQHLYGDAHSLELRSRPGRGVWVIIRIPFREVEAANHAAGVDY